VRASAAYVGPQIGFSWIVREPREQDLRGGIAWIVAAAPHLGACVRFTIADLGLSSRDRSGTVTGGARADRAWDKLPRTCVCQHSARCLPSGRLYRRRSAALLVRERAAPWFVKPRRVSGESLRSGGGNAARRGWKPRCHLEESSTRRTGPQPRQEVSSKFSASWTRDVGDLDRDSEGSWLCSWAVSDCRSRREMSRSVATASAC